MGIISLRRVCQRLLMGVVIVLVIVMAAGLFFVGVPKFNEVNPFYSYHGPAVRVNGITSKDADYQKKLTQIGNQANQSRMYGMDISEEQIRNDAMQLTINELIVKSEIKRNKIRVANAEITKFFNRYMKQFPTKDERFQFYKMYEIKGDADFKRQIQDYLAEQQLYLKLAKDKKIDLTITQDEIRNAYESITISRILLGAPKAPPPADPNGGDTANKPPVVLTEAEAKQKADEAYAKLQAGEDWTQLCKQYSTDATTKDNGGSMGETKLESFKFQFEKEIVDAVLKLKVGEYCAPIKTLTGYSIIRLDDRKNATGAEFAKEAKEIEAQLAYQKFRGDREQFNQWIEKLTAEADVTILDAAIRAYQLKTKDQWAEAAKFYERAVKSRKHRGDRAIFLAAMEAFTHEKDWNNVIKYGRSIVKVFKDDLDINLILGKALYLRAKGKDKTDAMVFLKKARDLAGEDTAALGKIKQAYDELKMTKEGTALAAKIKQIIDAQAAEQARIQKQMDEERKKQAAQGSATSPAPSPAQ